MPALQYVKHALQCDFGSTLTISHSSEFPAAIFASFDSFLKHFEVLVVEGGSRSAESSCER